MFFTQGHVTIKDVLSFGRMGGGKAHIGAQYVFPVFGKLESGWKYITIEGNDH